MPDLDFKVTGVEPAVRGLAPLLHFKVEITNTPPEEKIQSVILQVQIQIQSPQRAYSASEKEKLVELFGTPDQWGQTLRNKLFALANTNVRSFFEKTEAILSIPCTFDLNVAGTKYFEALDGGEIPLLFLFSGTIFYEGPEGRLQVQQISWNKESVYSMPAQVWRELMDHHYPNGAWINLERETFERLYAYRRSSGFGSWERVVDQLLGGNDEIRKPKSELMSKPERVYGEEDEFWEDGSLRVQEQPARVYDLEERTARFGEAVISFAKTIPRTPVTDRLVAQLVGAGTSVGANYCEADDAVSRKEFFLRVGTCRKESKEVKHFLRMVATACPELKEAARPIWREAKELNLIFGKICRGREGKMTKPENRSPN